MRRGRLLSSAGLRFTAIYFALYLLSTAGMLAAIYVSEWKATVAELDGRIDDRIEWLTREYARSGAGAVVAGIRARVESQVRVRTLYRFAEGTRVLAGNFPADAASPGLGRENLKIPLEHEGQRVPSSLRARTVPLGGAFLLTVAIDSEQLDVTWALLMRVALGVLIGSLLIAPAIGYYVSRSLLNQLDLLSRTISSIMDGQFSRRVQLRGTNDEFDHLGEQFNDMLETIERLMGDLRSVANDVAHDLRTPLGRLKIKLENLEARLGDEDAQAELGEALQECAAIIETFNSILKISEIESDRTQAGFRLQNLSEIVDTIAEAYAGIAEDEGRAFRVDVEPELFVRGDKPLLLQMLSNLVENAFKHTPAGTPIRLELRAGSAGPVVLIEDAGPGIPSAVRARVFDRFFRLERSRTTPGSGLGLSLVAAIARLHGVEVALSDAPLASGTSSSTGLRIRLAFRNPSQVETGAPDAALREHRQGDSAVEHLENSRQTFDERQVKI